LANSFRCFSMFFVLVRELGGNRHRRRIDIGGLTNLRILGSFRRLLIKLVRLVDEAGNPLSKLKRGIPASTRLGR